MTQQEALTILKLGHNVFLTGTAGSGKTFVLNQYIEFLKQQEISIGVTASTGIAATQIGGITINSWSGIGIREELTEEDVEEILRRTYIRKRILTTKVLVIDEISMLPEYFLDMLDLILRRIKRNHAPFGGIQVVLCGDFFQLPPVTKHNAETRFLYESKVWNELDLSICYLDREYRQKDEKLLQILQEIRYNSISKDSIKLLANRLYKPLSDVATRLYTHNVNVDTINEQELSKLAGKGYRYRMTLEGNEYLTGVIKKSCLAPEILILKKGALVMFLKNNFAKGYVNGTLGTVVDFSDKGYPIVETADKELITVTPAEWVIDEDSEYIAKIKQLPLRLAWAITIHKSQGMSLDGAEIDLGKPFAPGMGYVALSRVRTLEGIRLMGLNHKALVVNEKVVEIDKTLRRESEKIQQELQKLEWYEIMALESLSLQEL